MGLKIDHIILFATDMKRAVSFYRDVLGCEILNESPGFSMIQCGSIWLGLHISECNGQDIGKGPILYFSTDQSESFLNKLKSNHVRFGNLQRVPKGMIQTFYDSEGNTLGLYSIDSPNSEHL